MSARLFIRNDDVWTLDREFRFFFDLALDYCLPVVHAVIPGLMDQGLVRFLRKAKEKKPHLLDIVQHGWVHENHAPEGKAPCEFGALRAYESQREDIRKGLVKMREAFGEYFTPAFVPPYHGYDENTLRVLHEEGIHLFSAGARRKAHHQGVLNIPGSVSFTRYEKDGTKAILDAGEMARALLMSVGRRPLCGIWTHHMDFYGAANQRELTRFFKLIASLKEKKSWRVVLFSDIERK